MQTRRSFLALATQSCLAAGLLLDRLASAGRSAWAAGRKVLARGTKTESLIHDNPAALDATNLELTPLEAFGTMGPTDEVVDLAAWRLEVAGQVRHPLRLAYAQLTALPPVERNVLLICPGFFANHGRWLGFSLGGLLQQADFDPAATRIVIEARGQKIASFSVDEVLTDKVFLAYQVNGKPLPRKHGFPIRVVAEDHYGSEWVKYVDRVMVERA